MKTFTPFAACAPLRISLVAPSALVDELHARHDVREREEVARVLRQRFDLLRRDVGRDFGGARLAQLSSQ